MTTRFPTTRLRRLRYHATLRDMLAETHLTRNDFIAPLFVREGEGVRREIASMPGQYQLSVDTAMETVRRWADLGLRAVLLFGIPDRKDEAGSEAWNDAAAVQRLAGEIKAQRPEVLVVTDVCLCEYTSHGHCGTLVERPGGARDVDNDATLESLARTAVSHARRGADVVAPSAMMDGQIAAIRQALDAEGLATTAILSYAVKFASGMYGPFRDAAESPPSFGDRRTYQMDYRSAGQAFREAEADLAEGADLLMVKPAATYLDIIAAVKRQFPVPLAAYHVSGEYAAIKAAARLGWLDERAAALEITHAMKRAGADLIITYFAEDLAVWIEG
ncbi:MAG TPA: porphobilinogen synthase [Phycisphaerae bacterium]|nr:porphobilinogen synthase [Phycisphaerae bacterium]